MKIKKTIPLSKNITEITHSAKSKKVLYIYDSKLFQVDLESDEINEIYLLVNINEFTNIKSVNETTFIALTSKELMVLEINGTFANDNQHIKLDSFVKTVESTDDLSVIVGGGVMEKAVVFSNNEQRNFGISSDLITISNNGELIAICNEKNIEIYKTESLELIHTFKSSSYPTSMKFSPNNEVIIYGDERKNIVSINLDDKTSVLYENDLGSKIINFHWINNKEFFCFHLSSGVSKYQLNNELSTDYIFLEDYEGRYIKHGSVIDDDTIILCIEDVKEGIQAKGGIDEENIIVVIQSE